MSKKLYLTSYLAGTKNLFSSFISQLKDKRVLFVPTAANIEEYTEYADEALSVFKDLGFDIHVLDIAKAERKDFIEELNRSSYLYVSGGNTFYLLQELKKKSLIEDIQKQIAKGLIYIGESAGSIITANNINYIKLMDDSSKAPELEDYSGLNLVGFYVVPHYREFPFVEAADNIIGQYCDELNLLAINNHQAIIFDDDDYEIFDEI